MADYIKREAVIALIEDKQRALCPYGNDLETHDAWQEILGAIKNMPTDSVIEKLLTERDEAVNCIYGVQTALENGDTDSAMGEIITYNYRGISYKTRLL